MATAYKCDRCGGLYDKPITARRTTEITVDLHPYPDVWRLQLCDYCQTDLITWLCAKGAISRKRLGEWDG